MFTTNVRTMRTQTETATNDQSHNLLWQHTVRKHVWTF